MSRTNELRRIIKQHLKTLPYEFKGIYYRDADPDNIFPHIVFEFGEVDPEDVRRDYSLDIDIYTKDEPAALIEEMADAVEDLFDNRNIPTEELLPTFYLDIRRNVPDEDKAVGHILVRFTIQNYEREVKQNG